MVKILRCTRGELVVQEVKTNDSFEGNTHLYLLSRSMVPSNQIIKLWREASGSV